MKLYMQKYIFKFIIKVELKNFGIIFIFFMIIFIS